MNPSPPPNARTEKEAAIRKFLVIWRTFSASIALGSEARLFSDPPWRFDLVNAVAMVIVSIRMPGEDAERAARAELDASLRGWTVIPVWGPTIEAGVVLALAQFIRVRAMATADPYKPARV